MDNFGGIKELYDISIRLKSPLEIGGKKYHVNETILSLERAEIAQIQEEKDRKSSTGGRYNSSLIDWERDKNITFAITHGVLSPVSYALLSNSQLKNPNFKSIPYKEILHTIEMEKYTYVELKFLPNAILDKIGAQPNPNFEPLPMGRRPELLLKPLPPSKTKWIFCYDEETGLPIRDFEIFQNKIFFKKAYRKIYVDYTFTYKDKITVLEIGNQLVEGFLKIDGKMSKKDEKTGEITTAILELPKVKLSSSLSMKLGSGYENSVVSDFYFTAYPNEDYHGMVANITYLDTELSGEYL